MTGNLIVRAGMALFGDRWKTQLAESLGVSRDTVQDWQQGRMSPRPGVFQDLLKIIEKRQGELTEIADEIRRHTAP